MAGNVWEWCQDWYDSDKEERVLRGAVGTAILATCVWPAATPSIRMLGSPAADFTVWLMCSRYYSGYSVFKLKLKYRLSYKTD
jgi:formylglycine-generating enzyme required for sulfatase activity